MWKIENRFVLKKRTDWRCKHRYLAMQATLTCWAFRRKGSTLWGYLHGRKEQQREKEIRATGQFTEAHCYVCKGQWYNDNFHSFKTVIHWHRQNIIMGVAGGAEKCRWRWGGEASRNIKIDFERNFSWSLFTHPGWLETNKTHRQLGRSWKQEEGQRNSRGEPPSPLLWKVFLFGSLGDVNRDNTK